MVEYGMVDFSLVAENHNVKSVIHVGAWDGREIEEYSNGGVKLVVWAEPNYRIFNKLIQNTSKYPDVRNIWVPLAFSDKNEYLDFNITNNGESSSFMELGDLHKETYPKIFNEDKIQVVTKRFDEYCEKQTDFEWSDINMISVDTQGADLKVIKGFGNLLSSDNLRVIKSEVNYGEMYKDNPTEEEINEYLSQYGFEKIYWFRANNGTWGDVYWIK